MKNITLQRIRVAGVTPDEGTPGEWSNAASGFNCMIWELPDRANASMLSRVKAGVYRLTLKPSARFGRNLWHLEDRDGRQNSMVHNGNLAGDIKLGYATDSDGCLLAGADVALFKAGSAMGKNHDGTPRILQKDQHGIGSSVVTLAALMADLGGGSEEVTLTILDEVA